MGDINALTEIDLVQWFLVGFILIFGITKAIEAIVKFFNYIGKPIKWIKTKNSDHDLIVANTKAIADLAELHKKDNEISNEHDEMIREELHQFMDEVRHDIKEFTDNRIHDREQSREIQKELSESIKAMAESQKERGKQVEALMCGSKELLGNTIDERYQKYISLKGIPENEVDEFDSIYEAYRNLNGNHGRQTKYEYVKNHLPVIPVRTELILN